MKITVENMQYSFSKPVTLYEIASQYFKDSNIYAGIVNGKIKELSYIVNKDENIEWVYDDENRYLIYERTLTFIFIYAVKQLFNNAEVKVEHTFSQGLFCRIIKDTPLTACEVQQIKEKMISIVNQKIKIEHRQVSKEMAMNFFRSEGLYDKAELLNYRDKSICSIYTLGTISDYFYGIMLPHTGYINQISLQFYKGGVRLAKEDCILKDSKLFEVMQEYEQWGERIQINDVADLNKCIVENKDIELMLMSEAMIEKKLSELAALIAKQKNKLKIILIAGPSSAGKTTFSKRLAIHLKILGINPITISMDDFYLNRVDTPKLPNGKYDFDNLTALDLNLFNKTMNDLIEYQRVYLPKYDFKTGIRQYSQVSTILKQDQIVIVEGIHGLNPQASAYIKEENKFKIYVNALTHLNFDSHNRISTSDYRLIRRIVRDYQFRNSKAAQTISQWKHVKEAENQYIYPYQDEADYIFNTSMVYELAVLKPICKKLLNEIKIGDETYLIANRLNKLLDYFVDSNVEILQNSILSEFVGNSLFE